MKRPISIAHVWLATAAIVIVASLAGCAVTSDNNSERAAAKTAYDDNSKAYSKAVDWLVESPAAGRAISSNQRERFRDIKARVKFADTPVYDALNTWTATNVKPANYDTLAATLKAAQDDMIALSQEVR